MLRIISIVLGPLLLAGCAVFGVRSGTEQPGYEVVERLGESIELRRYGERLAAEVIVASDPDGEGRNAAFGVLFDYISGANRSQTRIAMTAPVETNAASEKIAMTAPVETARTEGQGTLMRFYLPAAYTIETAPEPTDPRVRLVVLPAQTVATLRYAGSRRENVVVERQADLLAALENSTWQPTAAPVAFFYDPPWTIPFLRRNEVAVPIAGGQGGG